MLTDADAQDVGANIARIMDDVWSTVSFGIGRKNREDVDHELFENDDAWQTPQEAGLTLRQKPLEPKQFDPRFNFRLHIHALWPEWSDYEAYIYWNVELEN